jgi:hypothetical protein
MAKPAPLPEPEVRRVERAIERPAPLPEPEVRHVERTIEHPASAASAEPRKPAGYGLPCAECRLYYPADLDLCPNCNSRERVPAIVAPTLPKIQASAEPMPDREALELEREEFLRQFKSQLVAAQAELANSPVPCSLGEHPSGEDEAAAICKPCYDRLQQRVDVCEAALHIDLKEAAQIVYDAVWADPSDPNKTYTNAANALLTELRKRAGIASLLSPFHPLAH